MVQQSFHNSDRLETTILNNLFFHEDYARKVLPFLKEDYFPLRTDKILFTEIYKFVEKYNNLPTKESISIELGQRKDINEDEINTLKDNINSITKLDSDPKWLLDVTEKFCKDRAVHNAVLDGIRILDKKDTKRTPEAIPSILADALAVSFDQHIGHD